jgi:hypothetical protein
MVDGLQGQQGFLGKKKISRPIWELNYSSAVQPKAQIVYTTCSILVPTRLSFLKLFL